MVSTTFVVDKDTPFPFIMSSFQSLGPAAWSNLYGVTRRRREKSEEKSRLLSQNGPKSNTDQFTLADTIKAGNDIRALYAGYITTESLAIRL